MNSKLFVWLFLAMLAVSSLAYAGGHEFRTSASQSATQTTGGHDL